MKCERKQIQFETKLIWHYLTVRGYVPPLYTSIQPFWLLGHPKMTVTAYVCNERKHQIFYVGTVSYSANKRVKVNIFCWFFLRWFRFCQWIAPSSAWCILAENNNQKNNKLNILIKCNRLNKDPGSLLQEG